MRLLAILLLIQLCYLLPFGLWLHREFRRLREHQQALDRTDTIMRFVPYGSVRLGRYGAHSEDIWGEP